MKYSFNYLSKCTKIDKIINYIKKNYEWLQENDFAEIYDCYDAFCDHAIKTVLGNWYNISYVDKEEIASDSFKKFCDECRDNKVNPEKLCKCYIITIIRNTASNYIKANKQQQFERTAVSNSYIDEKGEERDLYEVQWSPKITVFWRFSHEKK